MKKTSKPTDSQINERIARYVGTLETSVFVYEKRLPLEKSIFPEYTSSLDSMISVVEKLKLNMTLMATENDQGWLARVNRGGIVIQDKSPSRALALSIYSVLEEME